ncbi:Polycystin-1 [Acipenser ruthenus]|uniref:Polycystin-1 n=1 Tax=Acipenser ruthenus TaxID=7906 RepID=A0A444TXR9_ACIRT|nr:Polycystin-1 [Acipenser ruthenus]
MRSKRRLAEDEEQASVEPPAAHLEQQSLEIDDDLDSSTIGSSFLTFNGISREILLEALYFALIVKWIHPEERDTLVENPQVLHVSEKFQRVRAPQGFALIQDKEEAKKVKKLHSVEAAHNVKHSVEAAHSFKHSVKAAHNVEDISSNSTTFSQADCFHPVVSRERAEAALYRLETLLLQLDRVNKVTEDVFQTECRLEHIQTKINKSTRTTYIQMTQIYT